MKSLFAWLHFKTDGKDSDKNPPKGYRLSEDFFVLIERGALLSLLTSATLPLLSLLSLLARTARRTVGHLPQRSLHVADILVRHLRLVVRVERQRIIVLSEPRVAVAEIPEGHAVDNVLVLAEYAEHAGVLVSQKLFQ